MSTRAERAPVVVLLAGAVGVAAVVLFVVALAYEDLRVPSVGPRVTVVQGPAGAAVLVGRCLDERVTSVSLRNADGAELWTTASPGGSIARRYAVDRPLPPQGPATATVHFAEGDQVESPVDLGLLPLDPGGPTGTPPPCEGQGLAPATVLVGVAALVVVAGYAAMLRAQAGASRGSG